MQNEKITPMPVFRGRVALTVEALGSGYLVTQPGAMYEMHAQLCAATTLDEALAFIKQAIHNAAPVEPHNAE